MLQNVLKKNFFRILIRLYYHLDPVSLLIFILIEVGVCIWWRAKNLWKKNEKKKKWKLDFSPRLIFYKCNLFLHQMILRKYTLLQKEVLKQG